MLVRRGDDAGFTAMEVAVAAVVAGIALAGLLQILHGQFRVEAKVQDTVTSQEQLRQALDQLQRDLRAATPIRATTGSEPTDHRVRVSRWDPDAGATVDVIWEHDPATGELTRTTLDATGQPVATSYRMEGVANGSDPVFTFVDEKGAERNAESADVIARCTARVRLSLETAGPEGNAPLRLESEAELRNVPDGRIGC